jgi:hypothetical protein
VKRHSSRSADSNHRNLIRATLRVRAQHCCAPACPGVGIYRALFFPSFYGPPHRIISNKTNPATNTATGTQNCTSVITQLNIPRFSATKTSANAAQENTTAPRNQVPLASRNHQTKVS